MLLLNIHHAVPLRNSSQSSSTRFTSSSYPLRIPCSSRPPRHLTLTKLSISFASSKIDSLLCPLLILAGFVSCCFCLWSVEILLLFVLTSSSEGHFVVCPHARRCATRTLRSLCSQLVTVWCFRFASASFTTLDLTVLTTVFGKNEAR